MKYKVGDIVKLRDDLIEFYNYGDVNAGLINEVAQKPFEITKIEGGKYFSQGWVANDEMIEGLWEVSKSTEQVSKSEYSSVNSSVNKYKLIDILNKIANGELKEGTVVVWDDVEYPYKNKCLYGADGEKLFYWINTGDLNDEVELIEPNDSPDVGKMAECEHEWEEYGMYNTKTKEDKHFRKCIKCDLEEEIEPTDNTKIEELELGNTYLQDAIIQLTDKLNEVIRKVNKENNNG